MNLPPSSSILSEYIPFPAVTYTLYPFLVKAITWFNITVSTPPIPIALLHNKIFFI